MARRTARPRARKTLDGLQRINLRVDLAVGPDFGAHDLEGPDCCEDEAHRLAALWAEYRDEFLEEAPEWATAVLERGEAPPWEPDERFPHEDPVQEQYREHQRHLAAVARTVYRGEATE